MCAQRVPIPRSPSSRRATDRRTGVRPRLGPQGGQPRGSGARHQIAQEAFRIFRKLSRSRSKSSSSVSRPSGSPTRRRKGGGAARSLSAVSSRSAVGSLGTGGSAARGVTRAGAASGADGVSDAVWRDHARVDQGDSALPDHGSLTACNTTTTGVSRHRRRNASTAGSSLAPTRGSRTDRTRRPARSNAATCCSIVCGSIGNS